MGGVRVWWTHALFVGKRWNWYLFCSFSREVSVNMVGLFKQSWVFRDSVLNPLAFDSYCNHLVYLPGKEYEDI